MCVIRHARGSKPPGRQLSKPTTEQSRCRVLLSPPSSCHSPRAGSRRRRRRAVCHPSSTMPSSSSSSQRPVGTRRRARSVGSHGRSPATSGTPTARQQRSLWAARASRGAVASTRTRLTRRRRTSTKVTVALQPEYFRSTRHSVHPCRFRAVGSAAVCAAHLRLRLHQRYALGALQHRRRPLLCAARLVERRRLRADRTVPHRRDRGVQRGDAEQGPRLVHLPSHLGRAPIDDRRVHSARCRRAQSRHGLGSIALAGR